MTIDRRSAHRRPALRFRPSQAFILLCVYLLILWFAGGASRADVAGQIVVRFTAWAMLIITILAGRWPAWREYRWLWLGLAAIILVPLIQLIPLPPALWQALPGRTPFIQAAVASGISQPWRPLSIVPGATVNAASSLIVPIVGLLLATNLGEQERRHLPALLMTIMVSSLALGVLQFTGFNLGSPLVNRTTGDVSGPFANRNHFALLMALGCLVAPVWAFGASRKPSWRVAVAFGLMLVFALIILASGSRAGLVLGGLAFALALLIVGRHLRQILRGYPRWVPVALVVGLVGAIACLILISIAANRAVSVNRVLSEGVDQDIRLRGMPVVLSMIREYFPVGSGLGGFDPIFRLHEPLALLKPSYFNHAHNDLLELVLDAGLPGLILLCTGLAWWLARSVRAWRGTPGMPTTLARLGSAMLLLILIASVTDYPIRTPIIMFITVVAALWLNGAGGPALRESGD